MTKFCEFEIIEECLYDFRLFNRQTEENKFKSCKYVDFVKLLLNHLFIIKNKKFAF